MTLCAHTDGKRGARVPNKVPHSNHHILTDQLTHNWPTTLAEQNSKILAKMGALQSVTCYCPKDGGVWCSGQIQYRGKQGSTMAWKCQSPCLCKGLTLLISESHVLFRSWSLLPVVQRSQTIWQVLDKSHHIVVPYRLSCHSKIQCHSIQFHCVCSNRPTPKR